MFILMAMFARRNFPFSLVLEIFLEIQIIIIIVIIINNSFNELGAEILHLVRNYCWNMGINPIGSI